MGCDTHMDVIQNGATLPYFDKSNAAWNTIFIVEIEETELYTSRRKFTSISFEHTDYRPVTVWSNLHSARLQTLCTLCLFAGLHQMGEKVGVRNVKCVPKFCGRSWRN